MSDHSTNLITLLKSDTATQKWAASRIREDHVPQHFYKGKETEPFIWFQQRQETQLDTLDSTQGQTPLSLQFDLECVAGKQFDQKALAVAVKAKLHKYTGTFGDSSVQGILLNDKDNDYIPKATSGDDGLFVTSYDVMVYP
jgi:hypothetical protein